MANNKKMRYAPKTMVSIPMQPDITAVMLRTAIFRMSFITDVPFEKYGSERMVFDEPADYQHERDEHHND